MARKKLEHLFKEINYSNCFEKELKHGYLVLEKYLNKLKVNTISDEVQIKIFLGKFLFDLQFPGFKFPKNDKDFIAKGYEGAIILLEKIYPFKDDPPPFPRLQKLSFLYPKYSYKTESEVINIMKTGREGGVHHILKSLVRLSAENMSELHIEIYVDEYLKGYSLEQEWNVAEEYLEKFGKYLPQNKIESELEWDVKFHIRKILIEHPKMTYRMRNSFVKRMEEK